MKPWGVISIIAVIVIGAVVFCIGFYYYEKQREDESTRSSSDLLVRIPQGVLRGSENRTFMNRVKYYSFVGIPYAKPPIGKLRFKDPEPIEPWNGVLDATKEGNECTQIDFVHRLTGQEDCLYLNVFTPQFFDYTADRYPVMVWFHGGGFTYNSATPKHYGPNLLLEHSIVLVSVNYRLGAFGFLSLLNSDAPGNAGLKDQALALEWVKNNIHNFGGDPYNVTIFGESAGSASVQYHILSPLSKGLFHRAIMESGSVLNPWAFTNQPKERTFHLGKILGYKNESQQSLIEFLQNVPAIDLILGQGEMIERENQKQCLDFPFLPTVEMVGTGKNFLTEHPRTLLKNGKFTRVPTIIGLNNKEGILSLADSFITTKSYGRDYGRFIPEELGLRKESQDYKNLANDIKKFFFRGKPIDTDHLSEFCDVCGDISFLIGIYETINYALDTSDIPEMYVYEFTFDGKLALLKGLIQKLRPDLKIPDGVGHADELGYIFAQEKKVNQLSSNSTELKILDQMLRMWTNFAKNRTPNGEKIQTKWEPIQKDQPTYLNIGENLESHKTIFLPVRIAFWNYVFRKYSHVSDL